MSVQPPAAPHRVSIADIHIPFWRLVVIMIKWMFAAIPAAIIFSIIVTLITIAFAAAFGTMLGLQIPSLKM